MNKKNINELTVLKELKFNEEKTKKTVSKIFLEIQEDIKEISNIADKKNIYLNIDEKRETEKRLLKQFPFLRVDNFQYSYNGKKRIIEDIKRAFLSRFKNALRQINFISINEKNKTIRCKKEYSFISLYHLNNIAKFENNLNIENKSINIIKEYKNGNVDFKFKSDNDYLTFKGIVFYSTDCTEYIINKAPDSLINKYRQLKKQKYANENALIYKWISETKKFNYFDINAINYNLINKVWGL